MGFVLWLFILILDLRQIKGLTQRPWIIGHMGSPREEACHTSFFKQTESHSAKTPLKAFRMLWKAVLMESKWT